jgi:hypothetical protein
MSRFLSLSLLLLAPALLCGDTSETKPASKVKPVSVPFELLKSGHMAVNVKINGKGPYLLIFDTGAPMSLLSTKVAKDSGLLKDTKTQTMPGFGAVGEAKLKTLELGAAKVDNVSAIVMDHPTVDAIGSRLGKDLGGIVGFPFFARFKMTLDYAAKTMTLEPSSYKPPDTMAAMNAMVMGALLGGGEKKKTLSSAAQWGLLASKDTGDDDAGVNVTSVVPGSAAEKAGLKRGDRLLTLDGRWTDSLADLYEAAGFVKPETTVSVKVKRAEKELTLKVTPKSGL